MIGVGVMVYFVFLEIGLLYIEIVESLLSVVGWMVWLDKEDYMDVVIVFLGSGLVYVFLFIEVLVEVG